MAPFLSTTRNRNVTEISVTTELGQGRVAAARVSAGGRGGRRAAEEAATVPFRIYLTEEEAAAAE